MVCLSPVLKNHSYKYTEQDYHGNHLFPSGYILRRLFRKNLAFIIVYLDIRQKFITDKIHIQKHYDGKGNADFRNLKESKRLSQFFNLIPNQHINRRIADQRQPAAGHSSQKRGHKKLRT